MINYEEDWVYTLLFRLEGSVAVRSMLYSVPAAIIAVLLLYVEEWYPERRKELGMLDLDASQLWAATTVTVIFLLGFRTKQAFSRFWEGTGLLHQMRGEWFDTVSNCVTFSITAKKTKPKEVNEFRHAIVRLMSLCHGSALEEIAGNQIQLETIDIMGLDHGTLRHLKDCHEKYGFNKVEIMLHLLQSLIINAQDENVLKVPPPILSRVFQTISRGFVNLLNAKKITDTKFPFPYVQLMTALLLLITILTPLMLSTLIKSKVLAAIFSFVPVFAMFALNFIAIELENPFGTDANDLPLKHFQHEMNGCLLMLLHHNTDLIAGVSPRCVMDFDNLVSTLGDRHGEESERGKSVKHSLSSHRSCRLSEIQLDADDDADDAECVQADPPSTNAAPPTTPGQQQKSNMRSSTERVQAAAAPPEPPVVAHPPPNHTAPADNSKLANPEPQFSMTELQFLLCKHMSEMNTSFTRWTNTMNDQVSDLCRSFHNLKAFSDSIPMQFAGPGGWEGAVGPIV